MTAENPPVRDPQGDSATREQHALQEVIDRLRKSFADSYSDDQVIDAVTAARHRFDDKPIRDFVPIFVERMARERLSASDR